MRVALEPFARESFESLGLDPSAGTRAAVRHYLRRLRSQRRPAAIPDFRRGLQVGPPTGVEIEIAVSHEVERALAREAGRQGVPVDLVVNHAAFVYLADMEAPAEDPEPPAGLGGGAKESAAPVRSSHYAFPRFREGLSRARRGQTSHPGVGPARGRSRGARARGRFGKR